MDYEHPFDRRALDMLEGTPGFEFLTRKFWELGIEKMYTIRCTGSNLKVTKGNFPELHDQFHETCAVLDMPEVPELYLAFGPGVNAYATGVKKTIVVLNSGAVDLLEPGELSFVLGHELGHIKSNHVLYHHMAQVLPYLGGVLGQATLGLGKVVTVGMEVALLNWQRMSEFTADRAGLLACQDVDSAATAMLKIAGLPKKYYDRNLINQFIQQARDFEDLDYEKLSRAAKLLSTMSMSHPWTVMRCAEFYKWIEKGEYESIFGMLTGNRKARKITTDARFCPDCGGKITSRDRFCGSCGTKLEFAGAAVGSN